ncbi:hypothetical protein CP978_00675 [Streptomyces nodosus]|uniref:Uncharacterized protein n=1 Tax=Streptomyces nodosus TaxID=40318 RepID=A0A5P2VZ24_9ACTN|nr:hypothetical protein CP978_00675 [Streptomyces nodosus]
MVPAVPSGPSLHLGAESAPGKRRGCFYDPAFHPAPYASRIPPRPGGPARPAMAAAQERAWSRIDGVGIDP